MPQQKYLQFKNNTISYSIEHHANSNKSMVFLHGIGGCLHVWQPYMDKFKQDYNVLSIDLRGHGFSSRPSSFDDYLAVEQVDDVKRVIKQEGLTNITIIGHSFGAMVAMLFSQRYPSLTSKIIILGIGDKIPFSFRILSRTPLIFPLLKVITSLLPTSHLSKRRNYSKLMNTREFSLKRIWSDIKHTSLLSYYMSFLAVKGYKGKDYTKDLECEAVVISAERDTLFPPETGKQLSLRIKNSQHAVIENCGHNFIVDRSELLMKKISESL